MSATNTNDNINSSPLLQTVDTYSIVNVFASSNESASSHDNDEERVSPSTVPSISPDDDAVPLKIDVDSGNITEPDTVKRASSEKQFEGDSTTEVVKREFVCMNDEFTPCQTGQYSKDLSRKVISDHFGRNKSCTRDITDWPLFCRKHYQRATYNKELWQVRKISLILRQVDIIERQYPGTTYEVSFKKSEEDRLNLYSRQIAAGMTASASAATVATNSSKNYEAPMDVLRELDQYLGKNKSSQDVKEVVDVIAQMLEDKDTDQIPAVEFLPQVPGKTVTPTKSSAKIPPYKTPKTPTKLKPPRKTGTPKMPTVSKGSQIPQTSQAARRVSVKGSIKKTTQNA